MLFLFSNFHFFIDFTVLKRYRYSSLVNFFSYLFFRVINDQVVSLFSILQGWRFDWTIFRTSIPQVIKNLRKS